MVWETWLDWHQNSPEPLPIRRGLPFHWVGLNSWKGVVVFCTLFEWPNSLISTNEIVQVWQVQSHTKMVVMVFIFNSLSNGAGQWWCWIECSEGYWDWIYLGVKWQFPRFIKESSRWKEATLDGSGAPSLMHGSKKPNKLLLNIFIPTTFLFLRHT